MPSPPVRTPIEFPLSPAWMQFFESMGGPWQNWTPTFTGSGSMTVADGGGVAQFIRQASLVLFWLARTITPGGTTSNSLTISLPIPTSANNLVVAAAVVGLAPSAAFVQSSTPRSLILYNGNGGTNFAAAATNIYVSGSYPIA